MSKKDLVFYGGLFVAGTIVGGLISLLRETLKSRSAKETSNDTISQYIEGMKRFRKGFSMNKD